MRSFWPDRSTVNDHSPRDGTRANSYADSSLTRTTMKKRAWLKLKHIMMLPELSDTRFEVNPDEELSSDIVDKQYDNIWTDKDQLAAFELNLSQQDEENICKGIPTMAMAEAAKSSMRWNVVIQAGMCTATYANDKFILQLTNATIVAVLLSAVAAAAMVQGPNFSLEGSQYRAPIPELFQCVYALSMLVSAMSCFAAAGIALHCVNRLSNVCPSKTAVTYMTMNVFFPARDAVNAYVFRGIVFACCGLSSAFVWNNQNVLMGIPAAIASIYATVWFVVIYKKWEKMTLFHSDVADKLCAKDLMVAAERGHSISEGIWTA